VSASPAAEKLQQTGQAKKRNVCRLWQPLGNWINRVNRLKQTGIFAVFSQEPKKCFEEREIEGANRKKQNPGQAG